MDKIYILKKIVKSNIPLKQPVIGYEFIKGGRITKDTRNTKYPDERCYITNHIANTIKIPREKYEIRIKSHVKNKKFD